MASKGKHPDELNKIMNKLLNINHPVTFLLIDSQRSVFKTHGKQASLVEHAISNKDLKEEVSDLARAEERLNSPQWQAWCSWLRLDELEKTEVINFARAQAKRLA